MKALLFPFLIILFFSCSTTQSIIPNETKTVWVSSTLKKESVAHPLKGVYLYYCYATSDEDKLIYDKEMPGIVTTEFQSFCGKIEGFDFKEGYFQKIKIEKIEDKVSEIDEITDESTWKMIETIEMKKDPSVGEVEKLTYWIGPEMKEVPCVHPLAPKDCTEKRYLYQDTPFYRGGAWKPLYMDIAIEDYEAGYIYQIKFTKRYNSEMMQVMDGDNFKIEDLEVVSKEKL